MRAPMMSKGARRRYGEPLTTSRPDTLAIRSIDYVFLMQLCVGDRQIRNGLVCAAAWVVVSLFSLVLIVIVYSLPESRFECD